MEAFPRLTLSGPVKHGGGGPPQVPLGLSLLSLSGAAWAAGLDKGAVAGHGEWRHRRAMFARFLCAGSCRAFPECIGVAERRDPSMRDRGGRPSPSAGAVWPRRLLDVLGVVLIGALVVLVPVVFSRSTLEAGRVKLLVVEVLALALGVTWLARTLEGGRSAAWRSPLTLPVVGFAVAHLLALVFSPYAAASAREVWRVGVYLVLFVSVQDLLHRPWARTLVLALLLATAGGVSVYGWVQRFGLDAVVWSSDPAHRVFSSVGNPNMLGGYLVMAALAAAGWIVATRRGWLRGALGLLLAALLPCLFWTKTRAAWLGLAAGLVVFAILLRRAGYFAALRRHKQVAAIVLGFVALLALNASIYLYRPVMERFATAGTAARVRLTMWQGAFGMFASRPVLGHGPGTFQVVFPRYRPTDFRDPERRISYNTLHAHNEILETAAELGIVGLACFGAFLAAFFRGVWRRAARGGPGAPLLTGIAAGAAGILVQSLFGVAYRWIVCPTVFWVLAGLAGADLAAQGRWEEGEGAEEDPEPAPRLPWVRRLALDLLAAGAAGLLILRVALPTYGSQQLLRSGSGFADRGVWSEAIDRLRESIRHDPIEYRSYYKLAYCYCETGDYGRALETYRDLQRYAPDFAQMHYNLGFVYSCLKRWDEAGEEFLLASRMRVLPEEVNYGPILSRLQAKLKDKEKSLAVLQQIAESNSRDKLAQNRVGIFHYREGALDEAVRWFRRALAVDTAYVAALNNLAGVQYRRKDYRGAIQACHRILAIDPGAVKPRINLGRACYMVGDRVRATQEWRRVLAIDPRNAEALACVKSFGVGAAASSSKGGAPATVRKSATPKPSDRTKTRPAPSPKAPRGG